MNTFSRPEHAVPVPSDNELHIPVKILATYGRTALVLPAGHADGCTRCAGPNGCAEHPWFGGLIRDKPFRVPVATCPANALSGYVQLKLPIATLKTLCLLAYAPPLFVFFLALILTRGLVDWQQFALAMFAAGGAFAQGRRLAERRLGRELRLVFTACPDRENRGPAP